MADSSLTFFDLPHEDIIFHKIFSRLYMDEIFKCRRVCKAFKNLSQRFFQQATLMDINDISTKAELNSDVLERLTENNSSLQTLILRTPKFFLEDSVVVSILRRNPNLRRLDLCGCRVLTSVVISKLAVFCSHLRELNLFDCIWVSPKSLIEVFESCTELEKVDLTRCFRINVECITSLAQNCTTLKSLRLNQFFGLLDQDVEHIASKCPCLTHVGLGGCIMLTDLSLHTLVSKCHSLKYVEVNSCNGMTKDGILFLWANGVETDVKKEFVEQSKFWS